MIDSSKILIFTSYLISDKFTYHYSQKYASKSSSQPKLNKNKYWFYLCCRTQLVTALHLDTITGMEDVSEITRLPPDTRGWRMTEHLCLSEVPFFLPTKSVFSAFSSSSWSSVSQKRVTKGLWQYGVQYQEADSHQEPHRKDVTWTGSRTKSTSAPAPAT